MPKNSSDNADVLRRMSASLSHRGPDDEGFYEARDGDNYIGLAHRRLTIIDLNTGHQPLGNEDGTVQIIFNGEIYNYLELREELTSQGHVFSTNSDTEVIVHAYEEYGEDCVSHLRGMFAFAIWDDNRKRLFLARDRLGQKPLFLYQKNGTLLFASEIKALLVWPTVSKDVNRQALFDYFVYRYVPGPNTLFQDIRKLPPGSWASWERGKLVEHRYYTPPDREPYSGDGLAPDVAVKGLLKELDEAVRVRLVSDVPFGAYLSGGVDSSTVIALMSRHMTAPVKTFSVGFKESKYSELGYAGIVAKEFATQHHELIITADEMIQALPDLIGFRDAPVSEPADIPIYLLSKEARRTVKMVLTGEGADEMLGGYNKHIFERYIGAYQTIPGMLRRSIIEPLVNSLPYRFKSAKTGIMSLGIDDWQERAPRWMGALSFAQRAHLMAIDPPESGPTLPTQFDVPKATSPFRRILYFDQTSWLPDNLLERGDRVTMAASIEARMPFMDHKLIGYVSKLPDQYRLKGRETKWALRQAAREVLPEAIFNRPKVGFNMPINEWFRSGPLRDYLYDHLTQADSRTRPYYNAAVLDRYLDEHSSGRQNHEKLLWTFLTLEMWHRRYT